MPHHIKLTEKEVSKRGSNFNKLLKPILSDSKQMIPWSVQRLQGAINIVAYEVKTSSDYRSWRFSTFHKDFKAFYFETWLAIDGDKQDFWYLVKAYLNIYKIDRINRDENEYVCLHIDPEESGTDRSEYKQTPHIHVKAAEDPIPKAHISITNGYLKYVLLSEKELFKAMNLGIDLIRKEILERL